jgi:hypothetical protein
MSFAAAPLVLPWRETALVAIQIAKAESRSVRSNHFLRTVSLVRLALP